MSQKVIISGGGTGGHIFPALSIAAELQRRDEQTDILFVGAKGGMEMEVVPRYHYPIEGVWISGIYRQLNLRNIGRNLMFPIKLVRSLMQANRIIRRFKPDFVVGFGGFASGPIGRAAANKGIPLYLCEANAYPGLVTKWLAPKADKILLGNGDAQQYFPAEKTVITGNPIRSFELPDQQAAKASLGLDPSKPVLLSLGGSLGARQINRALLASLPKLYETEVQLIWQCGKIYYEELSQQVSEHPQLQLKPFIQDMATAYAAADLIISRAGGSTISELIALNKPSVLVPSPNVAEDHQTKNALSLTEQGAAELVKDGEAIDKLLPTALAILEDPARLQTLTAGIKATHKHDSAKEIADHLLA